MAGVAEQDRQGFTLGAPHASVIDERRGAQRANASGEACAGDEVARLLALGVTVDRLDVQIQRVQREPARRAVGARLLWPVEEQLVQRVDTDEARALRRCETR
jgi:hypothetical protein